MTYVSFVFLVIEKRKYFSFQVIQIIRPYNHSATQWWRDDISLLKTLVPFNLTAAVATATIRSKPSTFNDSCYILVFAVSVIYFLFSMSGKKSLHFRSSVSSIMQKDSYIIYFCVFTEKGHNGQYD